MIAPRFTSGVQISAEMKTDGAAANENGKCPIAVIDGGIRLTYERSLICRHPGPFIATPDATHRADDVPPGARGWCDDPTGIAASTR